MPPAPDTAPRAERPLGPAVAAALLVASLAVAALTRAWLPPTRSQTPWRAETLARVAQDGLATLVQGQAPGADGLLQGVSLAEAALLRLVSALGSGGAALVTTLALTTLLAAVSYGVARARGPAVAALAAALVLTLPTTRGALAEGNAGALLGAAALVVLLRAQTSSSDAGLALAAAGWALASERMAPGFAALLVLVLTQRAPLRRGLATAAGLLLGGAAPWGWRLANGAFVTPEGSGWTTGQTDLVGVACVALVATGLVVSWARSPHALSGVHVPAAAAMVVAAGPKLAATMLHVSTLPGSTELGAGVLALVTVSLAPGQGEGVGTAGSEGLTSSAEAGAIGVGGATTGDTGSASSPLT